jgi:hypothetical protein
MITKPSAFAPEGRVDVEGEVTSLKFTPTDFGPVWKMVVKLPTGAAVHCSVPADMRPKHGDKIKFRATFTRSEKDPYFAFGKIPKALKEKPDATTKPAIEPDQPVLAGILA